MKPNRHFFGQNAPRRSWIQKRARRIVHGIVFVPWRHSVGPCRHLKWLRGRQLWSTMAFWPPNPIFPPQCTGLPRWFWGDFGCLQRPSSTQQALSSLHWPYEALPWSPGGDLVQFLPEIMVKIWRDFSHTCSTRPHGHPCLPPGPSHLFSVPRHLLEVTALARLPPRVVKVAFVAPQCQGRVGPCQTVSLAHLDAVHPHIARQGATRAQSRLPTAAVGP